MPDEKPRRSLRRKLLFILAINVAVIVVLLVVAELVFRLAGFPFSGSWVPTENAIARFDDELGWTYLPGISRTLTSGGRDWTLHTDANGIRVPRADHRLSPDRPSVLFIGGSYTLGQGLSYEDTFPARFEAAAAGRYQAVNLGVQAYGTDQSLLTLRKHLKSFDTKVVVYTFFGRHLYRNGLRDRRLLIPDARFLGTKPLFALDSGGKPFLTHRPVPYEDYTHSYVLDFLKMRLGPPLHLFPPFPADLTKALIREMNSICAENGATLIVLNWRWSKTDYNDFGDLGFLILDTLPNAPPGWAKMRIPLDTHPDAAACRFVADFLHEYFRFRELL